MSNWQYLKFPVGVFVNADGNDNALITEAFKFDIKWAFSVIWVDMLKMGPAGYWRQKCAPRYLTELQLGLGSFAR